MASVAFVFLSAPHGSSGGREGLDALLATAAINEQCSLFFLGDGVLQILPQQQPERILSRNYISTFGVLPLYDIEQCYLCRDSLSVRGISPETEWVLPAVILEASEFRRQLAGFEKIVTF